MMTLCWYWLKIYLRNWRVGATVLLAPVVIVLLVAYGLAPSLESNSLVRPFAVALVDNEDSPETRMLIQNLERTASFKNLITFRVTDEPAAMRMIARDEVASVVVIPDRFSESMAQGTNLPITVWSNPRQPLQSLMMRQMMQSASDLVTAAQSGVNTVLHYMSEAGTTPDEMDGWYNRSVGEFTLQALGRTQLFSVKRVSATGYATAAQYYGLSLVILLGLFSGLTWLWRIEGEEVGLLLRLRSLSVSTGAVVAGRFLSTLLLQFLQLGVPFLVVGWLVPGRTAANAWLVFPMGLAISAAHAAILLLVGGLVPKGPGANAVGTALLLASALVGGGLLPTALVSPAVADWAVASPHFWAMRGAVAAVVTGEAAQVTQSAAILLAIAAGCLAVATWRLRALEG